ncbi:MAG: ABC transporter ATP-binding protein [Proteobacteria bacterium]|nr:ABC transporter ATP-binding protein [Pseudomonadota bacterium]
MITLELKNISKQYGKDDTALTILNGANFTLHKGEVVALVAPSGTGKSTLLHLLGLLDTPTSGDVFIMGKQASHLLENERAAIRNRHLGFVYQNHYLLPEFTSLENIMMPLLVANKNMKESKERAFDLLKRINLEKRASHFPSQLSGGEQQRVSFLRALSNNPSILLADEPTGNLDAKTGEDVFLELLQVVKETELSCLIATHNQELAKKMDRVVTLKDGQCIETSL